jgi:hypothetical protein
MSADFIRQKISKFLSLILVITGLSIIPVASTHAANLGDTNVSPITIVPNGFLFVATQNSTSQAVIATAATSSATDGAQTAARSYNLRYKDNRTPASGVAQVATVLTSGALSLYAGVSTSAAISATGGSISATGHASTITSSLTSGSTGVAFTLPGAAIAIGTSIAAIWTAPTTAGVYTISLSLAGATTGIPSSTDPLKGYEVGTIRVNVVSNSHPAVGSDNVTETLGAINGSLFVGVDQNTGADSTSYTVTGLPGDSTANTSLSKGLLYKDSSYTTAQTATILTGGNLALYALVSTTVAFTASGGSFRSAQTVAQGSTTITYSDNLRTALIDGPSANDIATAVATTWVAPSVAGTYTVSMYVASGSTPPTLSNPDVTLAGQITVTVVAAAAAAGPVVANSTCSVATDTTPTPASADTSSAFMNGYSAYINMSLKDAYLAANGTSGNIVVTATGGAVVNIGSVSSASAAVSAGTASTVVAYGTGTSGDDNSIRVSQGTAGAPVTTTVTVTFNGSTICTKTITIRGVPASMVIATVSSVETGTSDATPYWLADGTNRDGHMHIQLKDSAGNTVLPGSSNDGTNGDTEFSADSASISNLITAFTVTAGDQATSVSSSLPGWNYSAAKYTCGSGQYGTQKVTVKHTSAATGKIITGTFDARCAGDAYTYTASFDKASYVQGEVATLTVKFLDSRGNPANSVTSPSASGTTVLSVPMMTRVTALPDSTTRTKADGTLALTYTVSLDTAGVTAGTYNGIIDFPALTGVAATKQVVTYKVSTGNDTTSNADVLKSIVALIASINKQIQALQKLILKR